MASAKSSRIWRWHVISTFVNRCGWTHGIEVGVKEGRNLFNLLDMCPDLVMLGVDAWSVQDGPESYADWNLRNMYKTVMDRAGVYNGRCHIIKAQSVDAAKLVEPHSADFVFIDAQHTPEAVTEDIYAWEPSLKLDGVMMGHDIHYPGMRSAISEIYPDYREYDNNVWASRNPTSNSD